MKPVNQVTLNLVEPVNQVTLNLVEPVNQVTLKWGHLDEWGMQAQTLCVHVRVHCTFPRVQQWNTGLGVIGFTMCYTHVFLCTCTCTCTCTLYLNLFPAY